MIHHVTLRAKHRKRRRRRRILFVVLALLLYYAIGAVAPFVYLRPTGEGSGDLSRYTADGEGSERVTLIESNVDALELRLRLIAEAEREILITTYDFKEGHAADAIACALLDAADRGVCVRILVDGLCGVTNMEGRLFFNALSTHDGIELRLYNRLNPLLPWTMSGRLHDKMFIVDESVYIVGGRNTWDRFLGDFGAKDESTDRELLVLASDPLDPERSVLALRDYFERLWESDPVDGFREFGADDGDARIRGERLRIREAAYTSFSSEISGDFLEWLCENTLPTDRVSLITGEIGIYGKSPDVWSEMKQLMLSATERVVVQAPYIVCSRAMYRDLAEIDSAVPLTLVTNSILNTDNKFTPADYLYHQDEILETGAAILEYHGERSTHAKTVLIDDSLVLIGSFNLDMRSVYMNTELMVVVDSESLGALVGESLSVLYENCTEVLPSTTARDLARELPLYKRVWYYVFGLLLQPFRFEL